MSECTLVVFVAGDRACALSTAAVGEIVHIPELAIPPGLPDMLEGFLDYGGDVVPVVRLDRLFGVPRTEPGLYTQVLVLREGAGRLALMVDEVRAVVRLDAAALQPVEAASVFNDCVEAQIILDGETIHVLDAARVLLHQERERLRQLGDMIKQRVAGLGDGPA